MRAACAPPPQPRRGGQSSRARGSPLRPPVSRPPLLPHPSNGNGGPPAAAAAAVAAVTARPAARRRPRPLRCSAVGAVAAAAAEPPCRRRRRRRHRVSHHCGALCLRATAGDGVGLLCHLARGGAPLPSRRVREFIGWEVHKKKKDGPSVYLTSLHNGSRRMSGGCASNSRATGNYGCSCSCGSRKLRPSFFQHVSLRPVPVSSHFSPV